MVTETSVHAKQLRLAVIDDDANVCSHLGPLLAKPLRGMQVWNAVQQATTPLSQTSRIPQQCTSFILELLKNPESLTNTRWHCLLCQAENRLDPSAIKSDAGVQGLPCEGI